MSVATADNVTSVSEAPAPLTLLDRCDKRDCGAAALVEVKFAHGNLLFCGHDYRDNEASLAAQGAEVVQDIRHTLTTKLDSSVAFGA